MVGIIQELHKQNKKQINKNTAVKIIVQDF